MILWLLTVITCYSIVYYSYNYIINYIVIVDICLHRFYVITLVYKQIQRCIHNNTFTTTHSQQHIHNNIFTTTHSQQHIHNNIFTTTYSQQHIHNNIFTTTYSQQHIHNNIFTTTHSQQHNLKCKSHKIYVNNQPQWLCSQYKYSHKISYIIFVVSCLHRFYVFMLVLQ